MGLVSYIKTLWVNDSVPDIDSVNLNKLEQGIYDVTEAVLALSDPGDIKIVGYPVIAGSEPSGWLLCDGRSLLRADYPDLFGAISTIYGAADGAHFNLPDGRGRSPLGAGAGSGLTLRTLGQKLGEESHALTIAEMPSHDHGGATGVHNHSFSGNPLPWHDHAIAMNVSGIVSVPGPTYPAGGQGGAIADVGGGGASAPVKGASAGTPTGTVNTATATISAQGGGAAHNVIQPSLVLNYLIKT